MATVNFSVPDEVKKAFNNTFKGQNKSAIVAQLLCRAVADSKRQKRRESAFRELTERRSSRPTASARTIRAARKTGRP